MVTFRYNVSIEVSPCLQLKDTYCYVCNSRTQVATRRPPVMFYDANNNNDNNNVTRYNVAVNRYFVTIYVLLLINVFARQSLVVLSCHSNVGGMVAHSWALEVADTRSPLRHASTERRPMG